MALRSGATSYFGNSLIRLASLQYPLRPNPGGPDPG